MDRVAEHNRKAWDAMGGKGSPWAKAVSPEAVAQARGGDLSIVLTPMKRVPAAWLGDVRGRDVLCLASAGGQQAPLLGAAGARVTSWDNSPGQLALDRLVAGREGLAIDTRLGDMRDLAGLGDASFDLIVQPVATCFVPDVRAVWRECARVLRPGGRLLAGVINPAFFLFDPDLADGEGRLAVRHPLPYREDEPQTMAPGRRAEVAAGDPMEFSHSLTDLLQGQLAAGLVLRDLYEDGWEDGSPQPLNAYLPTFLATLAVKA